MKLFGLEITKAKTPPPTEGESKISNVYMFPWQHYQSEIHQPQNFTAQVAAFTSWVYVCASKNATAVASTPLRLYVKKKTKDQKFLVTTKDITRLQEVQLKAIPGLQKYFNKAPGGIQEVTDHKLLDLIDAVNPMINRFDLWELTELFLELTGNAYWYLPKNGLGIPSEI
jgi:phage portal protein BeeE